LKTIIENIQSRFDEFTRAEKQLVSQLLDNYPVSGLGSITSLAKRADVSTPTVARMVHKLGFEGFPQFQQALRDELGAKISSPIDKHERWAENAPDTHVLNRFAEAVIQNVRGTFSQIDPVQFDACCDLLADSSRTVHIVGGRITRSLADYFFTHLQVIRSRVTHMTSNSNAWPHYILDMSEGDILVIFDVRRYENDLLRLAEMTRERGVRIVLFTDQWGSPISKLATYKFNSRIEAPSAWDSSIVTMLTEEAIIAGVQERNWDVTRERIETLDDLFNRTRLFRKFT
jgi:DNA-binding MurR/RpiR family transcriptional regulator